MQAAGVFPIDDAFDGGRHEHIAGERKKLTGIHALAAWKIEQCSVLGNMTVCGGNIDAFWIVQGRRVIADSDHLHSGLDSESPGDH